MAKAKSYRVIGLSDRNFYAVTAILTGMVDKQQATKCLADRYKSHGIGYDDMEEYVFMTSETFNLKLVERLMDASVVETLYSMNAPDNLTAHMYHKGIASPRVRCSQRLTERPFFSGDLVVEVGEDRLNLIVPSGLGVKIHAINKSSLNI